MRVMLKHLQGLVPGNGGNLHLVQLFFKKSAGGFMRQGMDLRKQTPDSGSAVSRVSSVSPARTMAPMVNHRTTGNNQRLRASSRASVSLASS